MADLAITATAVVPSTGNVIQSGTAGVTITRGQLLYLDAATNLLKLCHASTSAATAACVGIALEDVAVNQPLQYQTSGNITLNAVLTAGVTYYTSVNAAGGLTADVPAAGNFTNVFGVAISTTVLTIINRGGSPLTAHS